MNAIASLAAANDEAHRAHINKARISGKWVISVADRETGSILSTTSYNTEKSASDEFFDGEIKSGTKRELHSPIPLTPPNSLGTIDRSKLTTW